MIPDAKKTVAQAGEKAWSLLDEFKAFAFKGNVVDLSIGVIIGGAFHKLIESLASNLLTPLFGIILPGDQPYTEWHYTARNHTIHFGFLLRDFIHFVIVAAILFLFLVKFLGWLMKPKPAGEHTPVLNRQEELLTEIRDLLRESRRNGS